MPNRDIKGPICKSHIQGIELCTHGIKGLIYKGQCNRPYNV